MLEDKQLVIGGWIAAALLGFLAGAAVFWTPAPRGPSAVTSSGMPSTEPVAPHAPAQAGSGALMGSGMAMPFTPVAEPLPAQPQSAGTEMTRSGPVAAPAPPPTAQATTAAPIITLHGGIKMQGDTVVSAPDSSADDRRRARMSIDVSTIP